MGTLMYLRKGVAVAGAFVLAALLRDPADSPGRLVNLAEDGLWPLRAPGARAALCEPLRGRRGGVEHRRALLKLNCYESGCLQDFYLEYRKEDRNSKFVPVCFPPVPEFRSSQPCLQMQEPEERERLSFPLS